VTVFDRMRVPSFDGATGWLNSEPLGTSSHTHTFPACFWSTSMSCSRTWSPSALANLRHADHLVAVEIGVDDGVAARIAGRPLDLLGQLEIDAHP
jgi:hypothetical protein